jgi:hypothetical protein
MKYQKPINSVQNSDEFSSGLMEAYGKWMGGDCFQNTEPVDIYNLAEAFDYMDPQSHGAEIEKTTTKKKTAKKESPKAQLATKEEYEVLEREEYELDGSTYVIEKIKGADGKACWKGYKYAGTKNGKDECVKAGYEAEGEEDLQEKMDPVGKEDGDIDNDGDKDKSDKYLHARRKKIGKIMSMKKK